MAQVTLDSDQLSAIIAAAVAAALKAQVAPAVPAPAPPAPVAPDRTAPVAPDRPILMAYAEGTVSQADATHVFLPKTGHFVSLPEPEKGELLIGYFERVYAQLGITQQQMEATASSLTLAESVPAGYATTGDPKQDWPLIVDAYANHAAYETAADLAADQAGKDQLAAEGARRAVLQPGQVLWSADGFSAFLAACRKDGGAHYGPTATVMPLLAYLSVQGPRPEYWPSSWPVDVTLANVDPNQVWHDANGNVVAR